VLLSTRLEVFDAPGFKMPVVALPLERTGLRVLRIQRDYIPEDRLLQFKTLNPDTAVNTACFDCAYAQ
jgi:hypothetical protein